MSKNEINVKIDTSEICKDDQARSDKRKIMNKQWYNSLFFSTSDTFKFIAGLMLAAGMAIIGNELRGAGTVAEALAKAGASTVGLTFLGTAAVATVVSITSHFISNRIYHDALIDQSEMNAQHAARYMAKELKKEVGGVGATQPIIVVQTQNQDVENKARADGKTWSQVVAEQATLAKAQQPQIG